VLTSCYWPRLPSTSWRLPPDMQTCADRFTAWYLSNNSSRRLAWSHSVGEVVMRMKYSAGGGERVYDASVTLEQVSIATLYKLWLFKTMAIY
jgi:hypothetical protein